MTMYVTRTFRSYRQNDICHSQQSVGEGINLETGCVMYCYMLCFTVVVYMYVLCCCFVISLKSVHALCTYILFHLFHWML